MRGTGEKMERWCEEGEPRSAEPLWLSKPGTDIVREG